MDFLTGPALVFLLVFGLAAVWVGVGAAGLADLGGGDSDLDADTAELGAGGEDHDLASDADAHSVAQESGLYSGFLGVMQFLGAGRVPFTVVCQVFSLLWGGIGFVSYLALLRSGFGPNLAMLGGAAVGTLGALLLTRVGTRALALVMPREDSAAGNARLELVGKIGQVVLPVDERSGYAQVGLSGSVLQCQVRLAESGEPLPKGSQVLFVGYDGETRSFLVTPWRESG